MTIRMKRAYVPAEALDGTRVLVDRLWPRGLSRERAQLDHWLKDVAPSDRLRRWYGHDRAKWQQFRQSYLEELAAGSPELVQLEDLARSGDITLIYAARDTEHNNAAVLLDWLTSPDDAGERPSP